MADSEAHGHLSVTPPKQILKDAPGFDSSIPLSPQWLLPKPGEGKVGMAPGGTQSSPYSCSKNQADSGKFPGGGEKVHDPHKKKDVYRPTFLENESARRDRWRDEERETNMSVRRDRWREGDKELGDARKMDRWTINSSVKNLGEAHRLPSERWVEQSKDAAFDQRRESKWSTRWGPNDKEMDKRTEFGKNADAPHDRGMSPMTNHGKDERDGDHVRPWRPNFTMSRGRTDPPHHQSHINSKEGHSFGHGRGDNAPSTYSLGRGRIDSDMNSNAKIPTLGRLHDKADNGNGEASPYRYDRTKLIDLYRVTNTRLVPKMLDAFSLVPPLTQEDLVEPFALCVPTPEESDILSGIDKGDIISSGVPQKSKDGSVAQGSSDIVQTRLPKRGGGRDDASLPDDDSIKDGSVDGYASYSVESFYDKQTQISGSKLKSDLMENHHQFKHNIGGLRDGPPGMVDGVPRTRELDIQGSSHSSTAWNSSVEHPHSSTHGWFDAHAVQPKASEIGWPEAQKMISGLAKSPYPQNEIKWQRGEDHSIRRQQSVFGDRELEARKLLQPAPEDLILYYKDPQGLVQGPFPGSDIIGWFEAGYFGIDLPVRLVNAPPDYPFLSLGDTMPHLRAKARPPPGFSASTPNEMSYISTTAALSNIGNVLTGPSGIDTVKSDHKHAHGSMTDAEKRYLESLMSSGLSSSPLDRFSTYQGSQGYTGNNSSALPPMGIESGGDSLNVLAKRLTVDRQKSLSNSYPNWPIKDAQSIGPHSENLQDPSISHQKVHSGITDLPHQLSHPQNVDLLSVLQGLPDSSTVSVNNGVGGWSNFPPQSGSDPNLHHNQNHFPQTFGLLQQRVQPQNHPSLGHMLNQNLDSASNIVTPENLLSSSLSQDPQILDLLRQKQLLQVQPQTPQQLSILDKILLIKQQQQQEEQLRLQQHQLLSQVLTEHHQRFGEPPYGQLHPTMIPHQILQVGPQVPVSSLQEDRSKMLADNVGSETSMHLPHHVSEIRHHWTTIPAQDGEVRLMDSSSTAAIAEGLSKQETAAIAEGLSKQETVQRFQVDSTSTEQVRQDHMIVNAQTSVAACEAGAVASESLETSLAIVSDTTKEHDTSLPAQENDSTGLASINSCVKEEQSSNVTSNAKHVESRKASEKKSRKQKSSKAQTSEKKSSVQHSKQSQTEVASDLKSDLPNISGLLDDDQEAVVGTKKFEDMSEVRREVKSSEYEEKQNTTENSVHRVWKPTVRVKPKSLLEIQQEEETRVKTEIVVSAISSSISTPTLSAPWTGVISGPEQKMVQANFQGVSNSGISVLKTEDQIAKKTELHDLLAAEVIAKSREKETVVVDSGFSLLSYPLPTSQADTVDDDFIEAKDAKKSRKKAGKAKAAGSKPSTSISSVDAMVVSSPIEKGKSSRKVQQERELLPAPPVGPSLGDYVPWKGESSQKEEVNAPAWSTDSGKLPKPASLRDILVEEQSRGVPKQQFSTPQKSQATQVSHTSKAAAPVQISSQASPQTKNKGDDDLFWGPPEHSKQENKSRTDFPQLGNSGSWGTKGTSVKATSGSLTSQKSAGRKEILSSPASAQSSLKVKRGGDTKHSEAMDFRCWCETESVRLTGSNDTSFLEFCLKQSRSEAEILLTQNLGGVDPNHKFIEKFLDYMDMLPADILAIAFQGQNDHTGIAYNARAMTSINVAMGDTDLHLGSSKGGKKKGKKGKKVSLSALGFNVVSNRIMMGEIQTLDD